MGRYFWWGSFAWCFCLLFEKRPPPEIENPPLAGSANRTTSRQLSVVSHLDPDETAVRGPAKLAPAHCGGDGQLLGSWCKWTKQPGHNSAC